MPLSRERAVDLSHRILERLQKNAAVQLTGEPEYVRNQILRALLEWEKEHGRLAAEVAAKMRASTRRIPEGSREWDLRFSEELERRLAALAARGE